MSETPFDPDPASGPARSFGRALMFGLPLSALLWALIAWLH